MFNKDLKIDLLANEVSQHLEQSGLEVSNLKKCAWEIAKKVKNGDEVNDEVIKQFVAEYTDAPENNASPETAPGNLSQTMRKMYAEGKGITEIAKAMGCKYVRVKNVVKKMPEYKTRKEAEEAAKAARPKKEKAPKAAAPAPKPDENKDESIASE
jgi:hypothetical protein